MVEMNNRLEEFIMYKTGGKKGVFAEFMGWTGPYLSKLIKGENFGIQPLVSLSQKCPELNLRWLLTGEGEMFDQSKVAVLQRSTIKRAAAIIELERYIRFMSAEETAVFEKAMRSCQLPIFPQERLQEWERLASEYEARINMIFSDAYEKAFKKNK